MMIPEKMYLKNFPGIIYELSKRYCDVIYDRGFLIKGGEKYETGRNWYCY